MNLSKENGKLFLRLQKLLEGEHNISFNRQQVLEYALKEGLFQMTPEQKQ